jgi:hypothetical protein
MMICITCAGFAKADTSNQGVYLGRCSAEDINVLICKPENGKKEACENYTQAPDARERIYHYKAWLAAHPPKVYEFTTGVQVGKDERAKPVRKARRKKK